jgi:PAS domain S-box-containing protein/putative nucleotidyltransferase with HDIG domain
MEESLRENEERFRSMIQSLSDIIFILDRNGQLTYESPSATRILGYQPGYFIGKSPYTHIHPDDLDQVMKDLDEVFRSVNPGIPTEFRYKKSDDTWIYLEALGSNQFENPGIQGIVLTVRDISERKKVEDKLQRTLESLKKAVGATIQVLVSAVESRDSYTAGHQSRSANLACAIATEMGLAQEKIEGIRMAGIIHDIGKLSIPAEILSKPTKLTEIEFALIKEHSRSGYEMLKDVESPWPLAEIVYQHHERMNGSGYPRNLKGDEIIIESQILAVADVLEAMASHRPYRPTLGIEAALEEIEKNKGILYDNTVVNTCVGLFRDKGYQLK